MLLLNVLLALVLQQTEVLVHLLQRVVLSIEGMDHMVFVCIDLIVHIDGLLDKLNELLHLFPEERIDIVGEVSPELGHPLLTRALLALSKALWTVVYSSTS